MSALPRHLAATLSALLTVTPSLAGAQPVSAPAAAPGLGAPTSASRLALGYASIAFTGADGERTVQQGVALELRFRHRQTPRFGINYALTWGLTDWDRAGEWIDAGNEAGAWTTERIQAVGDWAVEDDEAAGLRLMGAVVADLFLVMTYAAVPACYLASVGGATSHLQVDVTGSLHLGAAPVEAWLEGGLGAQALPLVASDWDFAVGPVVGIGADLGPVSVGARLLWSPSPLHSSSQASGAVFTSAVTLSLIR